MTEKFNAGQEVSRREFMVAAGAAAAVGGAIGTTAMPAAAAVAANEICRMDAVTLACAYGLAASSIPARDLIPIALGHQRARSNWIVTAGNDPVAEYG